MESIKVNYQQHWDKEGTHYNQTVTISEQTAKDFNSYVEKLKQSITGKPVLNNMEMDILYCLKSLTDRKNYINLVTLAYFKCFCPDPAKRILWRNTIIKVR